MKKLFVLIKGTPAIARPKRIWSNKCISINQSINSVVPNPRSVGHLVPDTIFESYRSLMLKRLWTPESTDQNVTALEIISVQLLSNEILFLVFSKSPAAESRLPWTQLCLHEE